jgi:hypothetical protein
MEGGGLVVHLALNIFDNTFIVDGNGEGWGGSTGRIGIWVLVQEVANP